MTKPDKTYTITVTKDEFQKLLSALHFLANPRADCFALAKTVRGQAELTLQRLPQCYAGSSSSSSRWPTLIVTLLMSTPSALIDTAL